MTLSVIVPVYKTEPYLRQCVDSILAQTLSDIELILVDDGSPDGCPAICDEYAEKDSRVRVIHKPNGGLVSAWKAGVQAASADFVGFVDSDDWVDPDYYEELYRAVTAEQADLAEGQYLRHSYLDGWARPTGSVRSRTTVYDGQADIRRLTGLYLNSFLFDGVPDRPDRPLNYSRCDKLYRRELLLNNLPYFPDGQTVAEDVITNYAVLQDCTRVVTVPCHGKYHYRIMAASMSHQADIGQIARICAAHAALQRIAAGKGADPSLSDAFVGSMIHARIYRAAGQKDAPLREKCRLMKAMLRQAPAGTVDAFLRARSGAFLRLFYGMLRAGLAAPCVWMVTLHAALEGQKH